MPIKLRYYYFRWEEGKPDLSKLNKDDEVVYETPLSKDGFYDGWAFFVCNKKLSEKEFDFIENLDVENGISYLLNKKNLKECLAGDMSNIDNVVKKIGINKDCIFKIRIKKDSGRVKIRGKYRGKSVTYSRQGRIWSSKANLNKSLKHWPLSADEEIVVLETREIKVLSGCESKYGIKN